MRTLQLFSASFLLASAMFVATMLVTPPTSEAAIAAGDLTRNAPPVELVGP